MTFSLQPAPPPDYNTKRIQREIGFGVFEKAHKPSMQTLHRYPHDENRARKRLFLSNTPLFVGELPVMQQGRPEGRRGHDGL